MNLKEKLSVATKYLSSLNLAYMLVLGLVAKALISDVSFATVLLTIPVLAYEGYKLFLKSKQPDPVRVSGEVQKQLEIVQAKLSALTMQQNVKATAEKRYF